MPSRKNNRGAREGSPGISRPVEPRTRTLETHVMLIRSVYGQCENIKGYQKAPPEQGARPDREHDMVRSSRISRRGQSTTHQHVGDARQRGRLKSRSRYKRMSMVRSHQRKRSATTTFAPNNGSLSHADEVGRDKSQTGARGMEVPGISSPMAKCVTGAHQQHRIGEWAKPDSYRTGSVPIYPASCSGARRDEKPRKATRGIGIRRKANGRLKATGRH